MKRNKIKWVVFALAIIVLVGCQENGILPKKEWTICFDANGGTGSMDSIAIEDGRGCILPQNSFVGDGNAYSFDHWNTENDDTGTSYADSDDIETISEDMTLYAIWTLRAHVIKFMGFDDGKSLADLFDTIEDEYGTVTIQDIIAKSGNALRCNLANVHLLDTPFNGTNTYQDFWVMFDVYVESDYEFHAGTFVPLILVCDSSSISGDAPPKLIGTPLYNSATDEDIIGFGSLRPVSNIEPTEFAEKFCIQVAVDELMGSWHNIKFHVKVDGDTAGLDLYVDKECKIQTINGTGLPDNNMLFDLLRIWYHSDDFGEGLVVQSSPNSNIYLDNIGLYTVDPDTVE